MTVGGRGVFVGGIAMLVSRRCVMLGVFVLTAFVMMGCLMVVMRSGVVVSSRLMVMLTRRVLR